MRTEAIKMPMAEDRYFIQFRKPGPLKECCDSADIILHEMEVPEVS